MRPHFSDLLAAGGPDPRKGKWETGERLRGTAGRAKRQVGGQRENAPSGVLQVSGLSKGQLFTEKGKEYELTN